MAIEQAPIIRILGFKRTYENMPVKGDPESGDKVDAKGYLLDAAGNRVKKLQDEDWVTYSPSHSPVNTQTTERVRLLYPDPSRMGDDTDGEKLRYMNAVWSQIGPAYEAFKEGREVPLNGTPLAAWAGVTPDQADILKQAGLRTVEEVRDLAEGHLDKVRLPNMREMRKQAGLFLANSDTAAAAKREAEKDAMIEVMAEQLAELQAKVEEQSKSRRTKEAA